MDTLSACSYELHLEDKTKRRTKKHELSDEQVAYLRDNYSDTRNIDLANALGCGLRTVNRLCARYGIDVRKSDEFMAKTQRVASQRAAASIRANGCTCPDAVKERLKLTQFKPGHNMYERMTTEQRKARDAKISSARQALIRSERRRILFGLPQRSRLRLVSRPRSVASARLNMRKRLGYEIERASMEVYITEGTIRSELVEANAKKLGFRFHFKTK